MAGTGDWREDRSTGALSAKRVEAFRRLMAAQERIAESLTPYGLTDAQLAEALAASEAVLPVDEDDERDFYLVALQRYVAALGGQLGLQAEFREVTVALEHTSGFGDAEGHA